MISVGTISSQWRVSAPPVGRMINIGGSGGSLNIDGSNLMYEGSPTIAQPGDTIIIAAGSYNFTSWPRGSINISNFNLSSGFCKITSDGDLNLDGNIQFYGTSPNKGVDLDFANHIVTFTAGWGDVIVIDENAIGGYERIKIRNIAHNIAPSDTYFIRHKGISVPYNNGTGTIALKDLEISGINLNGGGSYPIFVGGELDQADNGYCENVHIHDVHFTGPGTTGTRITVQNTENFLIHDVTGANLDVPLDGATPHCRFIYAKGRGTAYNCSLTGSSGVVVAMEMFSRLPGQVCNLYNIWSYNSARYSAAEFRSSAAFIQSGVTYVCEADGNFVSFYTTLDSGVYGCSAFDIYSDVASVIRLANSVAVNPQQGGLNKIWNGSSVTPPDVADNNNVMVEDNVYTMLGPDMVPEPESLLIGAGNQVSGISTDYNGKVRPNPPTIGACEPTE